MHNLNADVIYTGFSSIPFNMVFALLAENKVINNNTSSSKDLVPC